MQTFRDARKNWTPLGTGSIAYGNDIRKKSWPDLKTSTTARVSLLEMSIPTSAITFTASGFNVPGSRPALSASKNSLQV